MADTGATVIKFPPIYRVAYSDGDECGFVEGGEFRQFWQAEEALYMMQQKYPNLMFWVTWKPTD